MSLVFSMVLFIWIAAVTPEPVNMVSVSSGLSYGWVKTWSLVLVASVAYLIVVITVGAGFSQLLIMILQFRFILLWVGGGLLSLLDQSSNNLALGNIATETGLSRYLLIRAFKVKYGRPSPSQSLYQTGCAVVFLVVLVVWDHIHFSFNCSLLRLWFI